MDYELIPAPIRGEMYHPIGVESLYYGQIRKKNSTINLHCFFRPCKGTACIKNEKLIIYTPCPAPGHPEIKATILGGRQRVVLQEALKTKSKETKMKEWYEDTLKE